MPQRYEDAGYTKNYREISFCCDRKICCRGEADKPKAKLKSLWQKYIQKTSFLLIRLDKGSGYV